MRRRLLSLVSVALFAVACGGSAATSGTDTIDPPDHHVSTPRPFEPAATPYDGVTFDDPGTNPYVDAEEDRESTFGLDVDTASYTVARRFLDDGRLPDPASVRVEEYLHYFDQDCQPPEDDVFAIHADGGPSPFLPDDEVLLRVGLKAREVSDSARPDAALTFELGDVLAVADEIERGLPQTDDVHDFLELLDEAARIDR